MAAGLWGALSSFFREGHAGNQRNGGEEALGAFRSRRPWRGHLDSVFRAASFLGFLTASREQVSLRALSGLLETLREAVGGPEATESLLPRLGPLSLSSIQPETGYPRFP